MYLIVMVFVPIAIKTFLSEYYSTNFINMFKLLIINLPLLLITNSLSQPFIIATGAAKYSLLTIPFGVLNVVLAILLITQFGYIGAVYSILITSIISKLLTYYLVYKNLSRDFIGIDISPEYCDIAKERLNNELMPKALKAENTVQQSLFSKSSN